MRSVLTLEEALAISESVLVARANFSWPPEFVILVLTDEQSTGSKYVTFRGFSSRSEAWGAIEAVSSFKRPIPEPDQDVIDNTRFPVDVDCGTDSPSAFGLINPRNCAMRLIPRSMSFPSTPRGRDHGALELDELRDSPALGFELEQGGIPVSLVNTEVNRNTIEFVDGLQPTTASRPTVTPETAEPKLCRKHDRPIFPSVLENKKGATAGCASCHSEWRRRTRYIREKRWRTENIVCINHPSRRANRSFYVNTAKRKCASCISRNAAGLLRPGHRRKHTSKQEGKAI